MNAHLSFVIILNILNFCLSPKGSLVPATSFCFFCPVVTSLF